jgi:DNA-binding transcriptional LysR family regulator
MSNLKSELGSLDLDLLLVFDAVMTDASLSKAAKRLGMAQPTVSNSLARLRVIFGDPLFERTGHGVRPTARALELVDPFGIAISALKLAVSKPSEFTPASIDRTFILEVRSDLECLIAQPLIEQMRSQAPRASCYITGGRVGRVDRDLSHGDPELAIDTELSSSQGVQCQILLEDERAVIARPQHPGIAGQLTAEVYAKLEHIVIARSGPDDKSSLAMALERNGYRRNVRCAVTDTSAIPHLVRSSDLVATMNRRLAREFARRYDLEIFDLPISLPAIRFHLIWHRRYDGDAGHRWLRSLIKGVCEKL